MNKYFLKVIISKRPYCSIMHIPWLLLVLLQTASFQINHTENQILSRRKRYLSFPEGSNFVVTMSFVKAAMIKEPRGINVLGECDVPFKLPNDARLFRKHKKKLRRRHRRDIHRQLEDGLQQLGFNGSECLTRMICEAHSSFLPKGKSLVSDILSAIFSYSNADDDFDYQVCANSTFSNCKLPFLNYFVNSLIN